MNFRVSQRFTVFNSLQKKNGEFIKSLDAKSGTGGGVKFLTSNVEVLTNELNRLLGSFTAGNNNVFNEISAIIDELRRKGVLNIDHAKKDLQIPDW